MIKDSYDVVVVTNGQQDSIWVAGNPSFWSVPVNPVLYSLGDLHADSVYPSPLHIDGDDALVLNNNGTAIDIFGSIGVDPGLGWTNDPSANFRTSHKGRQHTMHGVPNQTISFISVFWVDRGIEYWHQPLALFWESCVRSLTYA